MFHKIRRTRTSAALDPATSAPTRRKRILYAALGVLTLMTFAVALAPSAQAATPLRIMPLGDSITGGPGCWRALLWDSLQSNGFTDIDFVGTLPGGGCSVAHDGDNEGHGGFLATGIANQNQLPGWLSATQPDIVLMHLGTNDVWNNIPAATILTAFSTLVDQMRASNPNMKILVAQIIPMTPSGCSWCPSGVSALNNAIPSWAAGKTTAQSPITVVDQFTGFDTSVDTTDGVHPDDSGFQKMSDRWYPALTPFLSGTTPTDTTAPSVPTGLTYWVSCPASMTLNWTAATDNVGVTAYDVFRAQLGGAFTFAGTTTTTSFTLATGAGSLYQVRARDAAGNTSAFTAAVTTPVPPCPMPDTQPPTTPGTPTASDTTSSQTTLSWSQSSDNRGVTGYDIYRAPGASGGTFAAVGASGTTSFTNTGLTAATTYRYQVRARDAAGNTSAFTSAVTVTTEPSGDGAGGCSAAYSLVNSWGGGFQGQVSVTNTGTTATAAWTVVMTFPSGQTVTQVWNAKTNSAASPYTVTNEAYNNVIQPSATTTYGFLGGGTAATPTLSCTRTP